jgi:hypothetical protein
MFSCVTRQRSIEPENGSCLRVAAQTQAQGERENSFGSGAPRPRNRLWSGGARRLPCPTPRAIVLGGEWPT